MKKRNRNKPSKVDQDLRRAAMEEFDARVAARSSEMSKVMGGGPVADSLAKALASFEQLENLCGGSVRP